ncbi:uncharacterized protein I206_101810 [Kwoniella pini CBS 10737]|uniref:Fe2OG dioxygenase domain-containing protein n=1 Tax=Kwoniella pini CBS 10737 TaxID=1296096 RepID=A0A1B9HVM1_9TREE|nr:uncharacterized protein I206_06217 [Kwoniella pini CBS 10737]OCF47322.1 hypothetical protein I206_06217 [Kwoniella pini CBS 10737]
MSNTRGSSPDSLFSEVEHDVVEDKKSKIASRIAPNIPGLWVFPNLLPDNIVHDVINAISSNDLFLGGQRNQVMLFDSPKSSSSSSSSSFKTSLPDYINILIQTLYDLLKSILPKDVLKLLFKQNLARQVIINLYQPGQGIKSHIDLPNRYSDGIIGCSLIGGCIMNFSNSKNEHELNYKVYMPPKTIYVLSDEVRWNWEHGIEDCIEDTIENKDGSLETILRDLRISLTFRWMKKGADLLN